MELMTFEPFLPMQFLENTDMTVTNLECSRCRRQIGRIIDDVYLCIGDARFFHNVNLFCVCGKPLKFKVKSFDIAAFSGGTKEILNELGHKGKYRKQRARRKE
jgi:hypothetical protein